MSALLPLALPAAALAAYLDSKYAISTDLNLLSSLVSSFVGSAIDDRRDQTNLFYYLERHAQKTPNSIFLWYQGSEYTFAQCYDIVIRTACWLKDQHGVKKGDIVAFNCINKPAFLYFWWALWALGATPAFINYNLRGEALVHSIKTSTANFVLLDAEVDVNGEVKKEIEEGMNSGVKVVVFDESTQILLKSWRADRPANAERSGASSTSMALLIYTSGTTGLPKAGVVPWSKCSFASKFVAKWLGLKKSDRYYTSMPLYHGTGALLCALTCLTRGNTLVLSHRFSTKLFWNEVRASDATVIQYIAETARYLLAAHLSPLDKDHKVKTAFGNGLRADIWQPFRERFGIRRIAEFYAATEAPSGTWNMNTGEFGTGAIAHAGALVQLLMKFGSTIVEIDHDTEQIKRDEKTGFCRVVPVGEPGELLYKLDENNIKEKFHGYYGNQKASDSKVMRDVLKKGDAWFRSGDVITRTKEGLFYFNDRIGDTYRYKSENVSTTQVSNHLNSFPEIADSTVYGIPLPALDGNAGVAAVVFKSPPSQQTFDQLLGYIEKGLPKFAVPLFIRCVESIEYTGTNKVMKGGLRKMGVDGAGNVWWLKGGRYQKFGKNEEESVRRGEAKL